MNVATDQTPEPPDFDAYWQAVDDDLARFPAAPALTPAPLRATPFAAAFDLRLTSLGPYRIFGYYSRPTGGGPFPALLHTPRYGSVNNPPHWDDRQRYAVLTVMHRGQRLADEPFAAAYPGLLTHGIADPAAYVYRAIVADCLRAAEFLAGRPEVDPARIGVVGDDLALLTAARRPRFAALHLTGTLLYRLDEARRRSDAYPAEEVNDHLRLHPQQGAAVARTLAYFDPRHHAPRVAAATLLNQSDPGALGGPGWLDPLAAALGGPVERYRLTHEGGTDHDATDAWLAGRLGSRPLPRLWETAR